MKRFSRGIGGLGRDSRFDRLLRLDLLEVGQAAIDRAAALASSERRHFVLLGLVALALAISLWREKAQGAQVRERSR